MFEGAWRFREQQAGYVQQDPTEDEHFAADEVDDEDYGGTDALVRESIQNSTDARLPGAVVRVRFEFRTFAGTFADECVRPLTPHLVACEVDADAIDEKRSMLVISDRGTTGLRGNPSLQEEPAEGALENWYWFWWRVGRSAKSGRGLGRWGLGRTVFQRASKVHAFFAVTVRDLDRRRLLMGQCKLRHHAMKSGRYIPHGFFALRSDDLDLPFCEDEVVDEFERAIGSDRRALGPGLTIAIPYIRNGLHHDGLAKSTAVHWYLPILKGELEVEVVSPGRTTILNRASLEIEEHRLPWAEKEARRRPPLRLARKYLDALGKPSQLTIETVGRTKAPAWSDAAIDAAMIEKLRDEYYDGGTVVVKVGMTVEMKDVAGRVDQSFAVALERDSELTRAQASYLRGGMTISKVGEHHRGQGYRGMVVVEDKNLAELLGDAEGPAHEDWGKSEDRPDRKFRNWKKRIDFVRQSIGEIVRQVTAVADELDEDLLLDVFAIESATPRKRARKRRATRPTAADVPAEPPSIPPTSRAFLITDLVDGIRITNPDRVDMKGTTIKLRMAYELSEGNPLLQHHPLDFDFLDPSRSGLIHRATGCIVEWQGPNAAVLRVVEEHFEFELAGFDTRRGDLFVQARESVEGEGAE